VTAVQAALSGMSAARVSVTSLVIAERQDVWDA
jgi:hypothetical protein